MLDCEIILDILSDRGMLSKNPDRWSGSEDKSGKATKVQEAAFAALRKGTMPSEFCEHLRKTPPVHLKDFGTSSSEPAFARVTGSQFRRTSVVKACLAEQAPPQTKGTFKRAPPTATEEEVSCVELIYLRQSSDSTSSFLVVPPSVRARAPCFGWGKSTGITYQRSSESTPWRW